MVIDSLSIQISVGVPSNVLNDALKSMYNLYIGEFEYVDDHGVGKIVVELNGRLNKCGVISPRFDVGVRTLKVDRKFGYIVLTTSAGIMDHEEARRKNVGGKVLGFFY
ncbi:hypothetical protein K2173_027180 [Erythroxylum novogranatense]|uniref:Ribosomal protein S8 n=1 Tax=Erythroxylum novogranatense TaxID=1862640 RepID=A0AAV8TYN0_9ROSI|nr:hypothetical protein K2173_027180 [Erythroxylum novogranatense]